MDYSRVVHGDQRFALHPAGAWPATSWSASATSRRSSRRGGHDFLTTRTEVATEAGEPVVTVWSKLVVAGQG